MGARGGIYDTQLYVPRFLQRTFNRSRSHFNDSITSTKPSSGLAASQSVVAPDKCPLVRVVRLKHFSKLGQEKLRRRVRHDYSSQRRVPL